MVERVTGTGATSPDDDLVAALVPEALRRAGLVWVTVAGHPPRGLWHVWHEDAACVVVNRDPTGGEQEAPGLAAAGEVVVTVPSKDKRGRLVVLTATTTVVRPGDEGYDEAAAALQASRLNGPPAAQTLARWREHADVVRLEPTGRVVDQALAPPADSLAAPPVPTPATTAPPLPWTLGRRRSRRPRR